MPDLMRRKHLAIATLAIAVLAAAFGLSTWSGSGPERSEAANEQTKTEMHLEIDGTSGAGAVHCDSRTQTTCKLQKGPAFSLHLVPSAIPVGGYSQWYALIDYGSLLYKPQPQFSLEEKWDIGVLPFRGPGSPTGKEGQIGMGDTSGFFPPYPASFQKTAIVNLNFNCAENGQTPGQSHSNLIRLIDFNENPSGAQYGLPDGSPIRGPERRLADGRMHGTDADRDADAHADANADTDANADADADTHADAGGVPDGAARDAV